MQNPLGSPDSGIEEAGFDMEHALLWDSRDPVMRPDEFEEEVDFMFNRPMYNTTSFNSDLDLDFAMPDLSQVISFSEADAVQAEIDSGNSEVTMSDHEEDKDTVAGEASDLVDEADENMNSDKLEKSHIKSISSPTQIHSYSVPPKVKRLQSVSKKFDVKSLRAKRSAATRKKKLYELQKPLDNPQAERCRLNAINAKKNRDRKKHELEAAESEIARLRRENAELRSEAETARDEREEAFAELEMMKAELKMLGAPVDEREE